MTGLLRIQMLPLGQYEAPVQSLCHLQGQRLLTTIARLILGSRQPAPYPHHPLGLGGLDHSLSFLVL